MQMAYRWIAPVLHKRLLSPHHESFALLPYNQRNKIILRLRLNLLSKPHWEAMDFHSDSKCYLKSYS